jgi:glycosyltransferase involved in cell wall biosynthesis
MNVDGPAPSPPLLSLVIIALNEVDRIGTCIESCKAIAGEIIVVDSGSTDGTQELAELLGARVIHQPWLGYVAQKQVALEAATGRWVLNLDADEALSEASCSEIAALVPSTPDTVNGYSMPRLSRYLNRWIRHGGWYPDRKVRLVRSGKARWAGDGLHERLEVDGIVKSLEHPLFHYVYRDISDQVATIDRFSQVVADHQGARSAGYVLFGLLHSVGKFLECYFWKLGMLDGIPGLIIAVNSSFYVFLKHAKAWEKGLPRDASRD